MSINYHGNHRFGLAKSQALSDSSKTEQVLVKCTGAKFKCPDAKKKQKTNKLFFIIIVSCIVIYTA